MRTALNRSQQNKHRQKEQNAETEDAAVNHRRNRPGRTTQEWRAGAPQVAECGGMARTVAGWVVGLAHVVVWGLWTSRTRLRIAHLHTPHTLCCCHVVASVDARVFRTCALQRVPGLCMHGHSTRTEVKLCPIVRMQQMPFQFFSWCTAGPHFAASKNNKCLHTITADGICCKTSTASALPSISISSPGVFIHASSD